METTIGGALHFPAKITAEHVSKACCTVPNSKAGSLKIALSFHCNVAFLILLLVQYHYPFSLHKRPNQDPAATCEKIFIDPTSETQHHSILITG